MHLNVERFVLAVAYLLLAHGCRGPNAVEAEATGSGETTSSGETPTAQTEGGLAAATESSSTGEDSSSTGVTDEWGEAELLTIIEGDPELWASSLEVAGPYLHVYGGFQLLRPRHWMIDGRSGEIVRLSSAGNGVVATEQFVYASGPMTDEDAGEREVVLQMSYDGSAEEEVFVGEPGERLFAITASRTEVFFVRDRPTEVWRIVEGAAPERLFALGDSLEPLLWIADGNRLLLPDTGMPLLHAFDLTTHKFSPLFVPPALIRALFATANHIYPRHRGCSLRTDKDGLALEEVHHTQDLLGSRAMTIVGDEAAVFWPVFGEEHGVFYVEAGSQTVYEIPTPASRDIGLLHDIAVADDALYLLLGNIATAADPHIASVWRIERLTP